ncbi:YqiA/YcfP family alpha/beta fold hydrolase [Iodobacter sp. LRB]|uniref:YqiA/YcfP family alpha/beta fold hydrolase n=1 Tax=unclassified Iodobacter TaxID=235634 RepID=UPI000C0D1681|nr:YqiA/YcfP family alpha/beta fold hydrolase [Iodobacter sp. BJB302]PHV00847.1 esterase YqiA [Iodobacter sp. BJB302]
MSYRPHIIYLHGFLSSPLSQKAQEMATWMSEQGLQDYFHCPQLPMDPNAAGVLLQGLFFHLANEDVCVVGSSLGGFFATWAAETFACRAVLINPAVRPYDRINEYLGPQRNYQTGEIHIIDIRFAEQLKEFERQPSQPNRYWLLTQTGDEVLDYQAGVNYYSACRQTIIKGGDHGFADFQQWLPEIWGFAQGKENCRR